MVEKSAVYSLSLSARATLDMHSLNNEGGEGNQIQTRMVDVVAGDGELYNVNAISGDMFKHIQAEHLYNIARNSNDGQGLPLCAACHVFDANRISADVEFMEQIAEKSDAEAIDLMVQTCALDDIEGNLLTGEGRSTPRKSVVEFGWVLGVPRVTTTNSYFHVKYARDRGIETEEDEEARQANLEQRIFHRPASSGVYAVVSHYEIARIGYNDIAQHYAIDHDARAARHRALLESVLYTFVQPKGAMRAAQMPHIVGFEGVLTYTTKVLPAPTVSPLNAGYPGEIEGVAEALNALYPGAVVTLPFDSLAGFASIVRDLIEGTTPYSLAV